MGLFDAHRQSALPWPDPLATPPYEQDWLTNNQMSSMYGNQGMYQNIASAANQSALSNNALNAAIQTARTPKVDLEKDAGWSATVSQLVDMWLAKFGSRWVTNDEVHDDPFYSAAMQRLMKLGKLESHYINNIDVYRLVE